MKWGKRTAAAGYGVKVNSCILLLFLLLFSLHHSNHIQTKAGPPIIIMNPNPEPPFLSFSSAAAAAAAAAQPLPIDNRVPIMNLSTVRMRMDSVQQFLSQSLTTNTLLSPDQLHLLSSEILSALHQTIVNGAALISCSSLDHIPAAPVPPADDSYPKPVKEDDDDKDVGLLADLDASDCEIMELDAIELLAEHIHFCEICGKGFKRDANLRMHMRAHGNQFKTPKALSKPVDNLPADRLHLGRNPQGGKIAKFSCPFQGCNRNKGHKKFRPLKSVICVKNHFKRSHCPKMYSCNRCNKKSFSVLADLKSHLKHCGENKWRCSCGSSFSRKDKLFGHLALFEGHMPVDLGDCSVVRNNTVEVDEDELTEITTRDEDVLSVKDEGFEYSGDVGGNTTNFCGDDGFFEGLFDGFRSMGGYSLQDVLNEMQGFNGGL